MININIANENNYFLPEDGPIAKQDFLSIFDGAIEIYLADYGFNMPEAKDKLIALDKVGCRNHLLLDMIQCSGSHQRAMVQEMINEFTNGEVTITTAGAPSPTLGAIWHWKTVVAIYADKQPMIFSGSVNFTTSGWVQGNSARMFSSKEWVDAFVAIFKSHRQWALDHRPQYQLAKGASSESTTVLESTKDYVLKIKADLATIVHEKDDAKIQQVLVEISGTADAAIQFIENKKGNV